MSFLDDLQSRRCLVTGSSGFLGSWVVERLLVAGATVRCLVRATSRREFLPVDRVELVVGDVTDPASVTRALLGVDYVFHIAGLVKAPSEAVFDRVNVAGTRNLLMAAEQAPRIRRVTAVSSLAAVGPSEPGHPVDETWTPRPISPYGRSKLRAEEICHSFLSTLPITVVRPPAIYGPRDRETLLLFRVANLPIRPRIAPHGAISTIHVVDLADGIILAATHPDAIGKTYFLGGVEALSAADLIRLIGFALGRTAIEVPVPAIVLSASGILAEAFRDLAGASFIFDRAKADEIARGEWMCTSDLARRELGFQPRIDLTDGITSTARWYRENGWL